MRADRYVVVYPDGRVAFVYRKRGLACVLICGTADEGFRGHALHLHYSSPRDHAPDGSEKCGYLHEAPCFLDSGYITGERLAAVLNEHGTEGKRGLWSALRNEWRASI